MGEWKIERVLLCSDFSESSNAAIPYGVALANQHGAELRMLHVGAVFDHLLQAGADEDSRRSVREAVSEEALSRLNQVPLPANAPRNIRRQVIWAPSPASGIIEYAAHKAIDLIVLATRGRQLVPGILLGSVARNVAAAAPCPVMCVRPPKKGGAPDRSTGGFSAKRILVPTDGSDRSLEALSHAATLAQRSAGELIVLHVFAVDLILAGISFGLSEMLKGSHDKIKRSIQQRINTLVKPLEDGGPNVKLAFSEGRPGEEIEFYAKMHDVDIVVMSRKGRRETEHPLGGVPERLMRYARCPVLVV